MASPMLYSQSSPTSPSLHPTSTFSTPSFHAPHGPSPSPPLPLSTLSSTSSSPRLTLPFLATSDPTLLHRTLALYLSTFGFFFLLAFTFLNMQFLQSIPSSYSRPAVVAYSFYSLFLLLFLLFFAYFLVHILSSPILLPHKVRDTDRVLMDPRQPVTTYEGAPSSLSTFTVFTSPPLLLPLTVVGSVFFFYDSLRWVSAHDPSLLHLLPPVIVTCALSLCGSASTRLVLLGLFAVSRAMPELWVMGGWVSRVVLWVVVEWSLSSSSTPRSTVTTAAVLCSHLLYYADLAPAFSLYSFIAVLLWAPLHLHCSRQSLQEVEGEGDGESDLSPELQRVKWLALSLLLFALHLEAWGWLGGGEVAWAVLMTEGVGIVWWSWSGSSCEVHQS